MTPKEIASIAEAYAKVNIRGNNSAEQKARLEKKRGMKLDDHPQFKKEALDPVGKEDGDVDNDGDKDSSDKYLMKRRKAIGKAMGKKKGMGEQVHLNDISNTYLDQVSELYKGKHGQTEKQYQDSRSDAGKMVSGDSKMSGSKYAQGRRTGSDAGPQPAGGSKKPASQGKMDRGSRIDLQFRKAALKKEGLEATGLFSEQEIAAIEEAMSSYDKNRKRAAQRAADRNAARAAGKTGVVPGVGYVTPNKERETYTDSKGTVRHKSGAKNEEVEVEGYEPMTPAREKRVSRQSDKAYAKEVVAARHGKEKEANKQMQRRIAMQDPKGRKASLRKEDVSMTPQELQLQKKKAMIDRMIAQRRQQGLNKAKKSEAPAKAMGEATEDSLRDRRMERGGVDGNNRYKSATKNVAMGGGKKKPYDGMSALEKVKASIRAKHGQGAIKEDAKMAKQSDEKLAALHKQVSGSDQSLPSNQFMMKRVTKEMNRRKKAT